MIKETQLLIKFWVQTAQINIYFYNWTVTDFLIDDKQITFKKVLISMKSFINYIHVWECKYYSYIDSRSLSDKHNKFMNWEWVKIFINYIEKIIKQYLLWISDLKHIIKSYIVKFVKSEKKNIIDLRLQWQTLNVFLNRKFVEHL